MIGNDDIKNVDAIHVRREHDSSLDGKEHIASMDCWCEPICYTHIEHPNAGSPIGIICHRGTEAIVGMKEKSKPVFPDKEDSDG